MAKTRSKWDFVLSPQGEEKNFPFMARFMLAYKENVTGISAITPQTHPDLNAMLRVVSQYANLPEPKAYVLQSPNPAPNAVSVPTIPPLIAFSQPLLDMLTTDELVAVTGHELGHMKNADSFFAVRSLARIGAGTMAWAVTSPMKQVEKLVKNRFQDKTGSNKSGWLAASLFAARWVTILRASSLGAAAAGRNEEYAVDRYGAMMMQGDGRPLMSALQKLEEYNAQNFEPQLASKPTNLVARLMRHHPSFEQRCEALGVTQESLATYRALTAMEPTMGQALMPVEENPAPFIPVRSDWRQRVASVVERGNLSYFR